MADTNDCPDCGPAPRLSPCAACQHPRDEPPTQYCQCCKHHWACNFKAMEKK